MGLEALAGIGWVNVTALGSIVGHQPLQRHVTAASVAGEHACETAEPQQDSGPTGCHLVGRGFGTFEPAKNKAGWLEWVGLEACGGGWMELIGLGCRNMADGWTCHYNRPWLPEHGGWMDAPLIMQGAS